MTSSARYYVNETTTGGMATKTLQTVSASQACRQRMEVARANLAELKVGQQQVLEYIVTLDPSIDRLTNYSRWHRAWQGRAGDPQLTELVEQAVNYFTPYQY